MARMIPHICSVCGAVYMARAYLVRRGLAKCCSHSCRGKTARASQPNLGRKPSHGGCIGGKLSPLYRRWSGIIGRCHQQKNSKYKQYGARGITVCKEWRSSFPAFRDWSIANGFMPDLQIDRIDNNLGYSPSNCRWVTCLVNQANRARSIIFPGGLTTEQVAQSLGMSSNSIRERLRKGMSMELAMTLPPTPNGGKRKYFNNYINLWKES